MRKILWISAVMVLTFGALITNAQRLPVFPIPSYHVPVNENALFREDKPETNPPPTEARRTINIQAKKVAGSIYCQATVWVYSLDRTTILGPFYMDCSQILTVPIDDREWGVLVDTDDDLEISVWITTSENKRPGNTSGKPKQAVAEPRQNGSEAGCRFCFN